MFASRMTQSILFSLVLILGLSWAGFAQDKKKKDKKPKPIPTGTPVLWRDPGDIAKLDLRFGAGSAGLAPAPPFTFIREEKKAGASPKFRVKDANGTTWTVKLGVEAQAETVSTRVVWAMGYFTEETYYLDRFEVKNLPRLSKGQEFVESGGIVRGARFEPKRKGVTRGPIWDWLKNPFVGSRELDGLKVLMVLLANYDTRLENNHILYEKNSAGIMEARYVVTDIGATLGRVGGLGGKRVKNSLADFQDTKFIVAVQNGIVEFDYSTKPKGAGKFASMFNPGYGKSQANKEKAMRHIPVVHARWMGEMLDRITGDQWKDIFRAANYDEATMKGFIKTLRERIDRLAKLS